MNDSIAQGRGSKGRTDPIRTGRAKGKLEAKVWREVKKKLTVQCEQQPVKAELGVCRSQLIAAVPIIIIGDSLL